MSKRETTLRHHLIIKKLRTSKRADFIEIADYLKQESEIHDYNFNISKRTFQRDINDIASIYGIYIKCNYYGKYYFIEEDLESESEKRFFEAFDLYNALKMNEQYQKYIYLEKRKAQGTEHIYSLLNAIKNRVQVTFSYQKYYTEYAVLRTVNPLILKEFRYRWYLVARDLYDNRVKIYALDRMSDLIISKQNFPEDNDFDLEKTMQHCFGIIIPENKKLQNVILSFTPFQGKYIKSLPLHSTQKTIIDNQEELRISLNIYITEDFKMEILSFGENVKVLKPKCFVNEIKKIYLSASEQYQ